MGSIMRSELWSVVLGLTDGRRRTFVELRKATNRDLKEDATRGMKQRCKSIQHIDTHSRLSLLKDAGSNGNSSMPPESRLPCRTLFRTDPLVQRSLPHWPSHIVLRSVGYGTGAKRAIFRDVLD